MAGDGSTMLFDTNHETLRLRSYQVEMVEASLHSNIIVVMDTGSGKTHIAIERARVELETCSSEKLVWFLAPTVTLCEQQHEAFKKYLPGCGIQLLSGKDGVEHWTDQGIWDAVLHNVRIVLSTHQVLLDALTHAFVKMSRLALLIFDEAHHCTQNHPAHIIMSGFYRHAASESHSLVPRILGLTASPVMKARATSESLERIERNLHATASIPRVHRSQLIQYVHQPELVQIDYNVESGPGPVSPLLLSLREIYVNYDLERDPYVVYLKDKKQCGSDTSRALQKVYTSGKTYCIEELRGLINKASDMQQELGKSAVDWYLHQCVTRFGEMMQAMDGQISDLVVAEKLHLSSLFEKLLLRERIIENPIASDQLSHKVLKLIDVLQHEVKGSTNFTGIVFVEQRAWVTVLAEILKSHCNTKDVFRVGTFVGTSQSDQRKATVATLAEPKKQNTDLNDFRSGKVNLILATSVLEEGIDVSSCNAVVCFECPKNLKSFVQRRGRARKQTSRYLIFNANSGDSATLGSWQTLEAEMRAAYEDDLRRARLAQEKERFEEVGVRSFRVPKTGALLTLDNASQHLHHFCSLLSSGRYTDMRPQFQFADESNQIRARVTLPLSVAPELRTAESLQLWSSERMAKKDAAFEAYLGLHQAGLVNDNLLPLRRADDDADSLYQSEDSGPALVTMRGLLDPWSKIQQNLTQDPCLWHRTLIKISRQHEEPIQITLYTPTALQTMVTTILYWNEDIEYCVESSCVPDIVLSHKELETLRLVTQRIFSSVFESRMPDDYNDFLWLLDPCSSQGSPLDLAALSEWNGRVQGESALEEYISQTSMHISDAGLIRKQGGQRQYMLNTETDMDTVRLASSLDDFTVAIKRVPKRRDFLHKVLKTRNVSQAYTRIEHVSPSEYVMENLPAQYAVFALLFPSVLRRIEIAIIVERLRTSILQPVQFGTSDLPILTKALTSSSTGEENDYQRLEFLGDCILKFVSSVHLMATHPTWPEGYLTGKKGKIVSNGFLARASLAAGLDEYIIAKRFTGSKWRPRYVHEVQDDSQTPATQEISSKVAADVVEALIGASYMVGGFPKAVICIQTLLTKEDWMPLTQATESLYESAWDESTITGFAIPEALIGRTFSKKAVLVEALTHASYNGPNVHCSYERLEFLGDAVLDYLVSERLYTHASDLPHHVMHGRRTAMVNAAFLTFRMFELTIEEEMTDKSSMQPALQERALWQFLRCGSHEVVAARHAAFEQHKRLRDRIATALKEDTVFPWHLFALTNAPKFMSDMVESVLGAIFVDSCGDITACKSFVQRLGILDCLERILRDNVDCLHPKQRLGHLAVEKDVKYERVLDDYDGSGKQYFCQVKVGGELVGGVVEGPKKLNAETIAAWHAVRLLGSSKDAAMQDVSDSDVFFDADEGGIAITND